MLATQTIRQRRSRNMRITVDGVLRPHVQAKDLALHLLAAIGVDGATGHVIEYAGSAIGALSMEARMTLCNLSIEMGARAGLIAPDDTTFAYLADRPAVPKRDAWTAALARWRALPTDAGAVFDRELRIDAGAVAPMVSWGTNPSQVIAVDGVVPDPAALADPDARAVAERALAFGIGTSEVEHVLATQTIRQRRSRNMRITVDRAGVGAGQTTGRGGRDRPHPARSGLRLARARLFDVRRDERGPPFAWRTLRGDVEPQFRESTGARRPHPSDEPRARGGERDCRLHRRSGDPDR